MMQTVSMCWLQPFPSRLPYDIVRCNLNFISFFPLLLSLYSLSLSRFFKQKYSLTLDLISIMAARAAITAARLSILSNVRVNIGHCQLFPRPDTVAVRKKTWTHTRQAAESGQSQTADNGFLCLEHEFLIYIFISHVHLLYIISEFIEIVHESVSQWHRPSKWVIEWNIEQRNTDDGEHKKGGFSMAQK